MMVDWRVYWDFDKMGEQGSVPAAKKHFPYQSPPCNQPPGSDTAGQHEHTFHPSTEERR